MYFICDHCHYVFSTDALPHRCPDCGDLAVRCATTSEKAEHLRLLEMVDVDNWDDTLEHSSVPGGLPGNHRRASDGQVRA